MEVVSNFENAKMNKLKSLGFIIVILATILVLLVVRLSNKNLFKQDVALAIEAGTDEKNLISVVELEQSSAYLVVQLNSAESTNFAEFKNSIKIPFQNLLEKENQKLLKETKGKIVLLSEDISTASKAWVILNQLGFENVFILKNKENSEVFKYKFQPDTVARLE